MGRLIFLLGGARSGKSTYAENWAKANGERVLFVATAQALDDEMHARIAKHQAQRPPDWNTLEAPVSAGAAIESAFAKTSYDTVLLDCVTLLVSNVLLSLPEDADQESVNAAVIAEVEALLGACEHTGAAWLVVSNEVGMGLVPPYRLGRLYRDALGMANQCIAQAADEVLLLGAGLPWALK
jgi:adenosylcobinamide kinase / adenosylcobinamide-phosphate guanylyltransferase